MAREGASYPAYVIKFFFENNRGVEKIAPLPYQLIRSLSRAGVTISVPDDGGPRALDPPQDSAFTVRIGPR